MEFLARVAASLSELYSAALAIPAVELETSGIGPEPRSHEAWKALYDSLGEKLGPLNLYWEVFDSTVQEESIAGTLADDISDIYFDLKEILQFARRPEATDVDVAWQVRFKFFANWGQHLTGALKAIHDLMSHSYFE